MSKIDFVYCLFCSTGHENIVSEIIKTKGYNVIPVTAKRVIIEHGKRKSVLRHLLPGYIFFGSDIKLNGNDLKTLLTNEYMIKFIGYADGTKEIRGSDLEFVYMFVRNEGKFEALEAVEIDSYVTVTDGVLKSFNGKVIKINRRRKCALIEFELFENNNRIWLSYKVIEKRI
jgi:transcription antitermination factor NusG